MRQDAYWVVVAGSFIVSDGKVSTGMARLLLQLTSASLEFMLQTLQELIRSFRSRMDGADRF